MSETVKRIERLIEKAEKAGNAPDAMQFAQAALNAANATRSICEAMNIYPGAFMQKPTLAASVSDAVTAGVMTPNEGRAGCGLPPVTRAMDG